MPRTSIVAPLLPTTCSEAQYIAPIARGFACPWSLPSDFTPMPASAKMTPRWAPSAYTPRATMRASWAMACCRATPHATWPIWCRPTSPRRRASHAAPCGTRTTANHASPMCPRASSSCSRTRTLPICAMPTTRTSSSLPREPYTKEYCTMLPRCMAPSTPYSPSPCTPLPSTLLMMTRCASRGGLPRIAGSPQPRPTAMCSTRAPMTEVGTMGNASALPRATSPWSLAVCIASRSRPSIEAARASPPRCSQHMSPQSPKDECWW